MKSNIITSFKRCFVLEAFVLINKDPCTFQLMIHGNNLSIGQSTVSIDNNLYFLKKMHSNALIMISIKNKCTIKVQKKKKKKIRSTGFNQNEKPYIEMG